MKLELINDFIKKYINEDYECFEDYEFTSDWEDGTIWVTFEETPEDDLFFNNFIKKTFNQEFDTFLISMLHELGHLETEDEELSNDRAMKLWLYQEWFEKGLVSKEEYYNYYFNIDTEYLATQWAVEFAKTHEQECKELVNALHF